MKTTRILEPHEVAELVLGLPTSEMMELEKATRKAQNEKQFLAIASAWLNEYKERKALQDAQVPPE